MSAPVGARTTKDVPGSAPCGAVNVKSSKARRTSGAGGVRVVALTCKSNSESGLAPPRWSRRRVDGVVEVDATIQMKGRLSIFSRTVLALDGRDEGAAKFDFWLVALTCAVACQSAGELRHELAAGGARDRVGRAQLRLDERRRRAGPRRDGPTDDGRGLDSYRVEINQCVGFDATIQHERAVKF